MQYKNVISLDDFFNVLHDSELPVLVKFGATWCGPCKILSQAIADADLHGLTFVEIDIEEVPDVANYYSLMSVPVTMLFVDEFCVWNHSGVLSATQIKEAIDKTLEA